MKTYDDFLNAIAEVFPKKVSVYACSLRDPSTLNDVIQHSLARFEAKSKRTEKGILVYSNNDNVQLADFAQSIVITSDKEIIFYRSEYFVFIPKNFQEEIVLEMHL